MKVKTNDELCLEAARFCGLTPDEVAEALLGLRRAVKARLNRGESATVRGLGRFELRRLQARTYRPPGGPAVRAPARIAPAFFLSTKLRAGFTRAADEPQNTP